MPIGDNSFLWHVRAGTYQLDLGRVITVDPFSFTELGKPWRTQSWLAELGYGWLERLTGGIGWVPVMKMLAISLTVALVGLVVHHVGRRRHWLTLGLLVLLVWQASPFAIARPALLGFVLLALVIAAVHSRTRPLWLLPPLFWLWASVHGMFVVGLGYLLLDALRRRSRRQTVAVALSGLATLFAAHGLGTWWILVQFLRNRPALSLLSEWQPPDFSSGLVLPFLLLIVALVVVGALGRLRPSDLWIAVPFLVFGLMAERNIWPAVLALTPIVARFPNAPPERERRGGEVVLVNWAIAMLLIVVAAAGLVRIAPLEPKRFPSDAALAALGDGPQFNDSAVGGYLIYREWPDRLVYTDDRAEVYGAEAIRRFQKVESGIGVAEEFAGYGIEQAIVPVDWGLVDELDLLGWQAAYRDDYFVVMRAP
jgi:hypothetical protein